MVPTICIPFDAEQFRPLRDRTRSTYSSTFHTQSVLSNDTLLHSQWRQKLSNVDTLRVSSQLENDCRSAKDDVRQSQCRASQQQAVRQNDLRKTISTLDVQSMRETLYHATLGNMFLLWITFQVLDLYHTRVQAELVEVEKAQKA